jgi:hypothetical protein
MSLIKYDHFDRTLGYVLGYVRQRTLPVAL